MRALLLVAMLVSTASASAGLTWSSEWKSTFEKARAEERLVVVEARSSNCAACQEMDRTTWSDPAVVTALEPFLLLRLDADQTDAMGPYRIGAFRGIAVFDPTGQPRFRYAGYQAPQSFVHQLREINRLKPMLISAATRLARGDTIKGNLELGDFYECTKNHQAARKAFEAAAVAAGSVADERNLLLARVRVAATWVQDNPEHAMSELKKIGESAIREVEMYRQAVFAAALMRVGRPKAAKAAFRRALKSCPDEMKQECEEHLREMDRARMYIPRIDEWPASRNNPPARSDPRRPQ